MKRPAELIHGPVLIGTLLNVLLFGIMITQSYLYYTTYSRDRVWMKLLVSAVLITDTLNTLFDVISIYESVIVSFGDLESLQRTTWAGVAGIVVAVASAIYCG